MESAVINACEIFSKGDVLSISSYMDDKVVWEIVGEETITGKDELLLFCEEMNLDGKPDFENIKTTLGLDQIIIEGFDKKSNSFFYCDSYGIKENKIISIRSYCVNTD